VRFQAHLQHHINAVSQGEQAMNKSSNAVVSEWRNNAEQGNPAGPLFASGQFAQADIVCETWNGSGQCGTACTQSIDRMCC
jgi:hypothetical protein